MLAPLAASYAPVAAYLAASVGWLALARWRPSLWPAPAPLSTDRRFGDLALALLAVAGVAVLGQAYRLGFLIPTGRFGWWRHVAWTLDSLLIYSPVLITLSEHRGSWRTAFLSRERLAVKLAAGVALGAVAVATFLALRWSAARFPAALGAAVNIAGAAEFVPDFLRIVTIAFVFVRLRWAFGTRVTVLALSLGFAVTRVPDRIVSGWPAPEIGALFVADALLAAAVVAVGARSEDVVWLGVVTYLLGAAKGAASGAM
ncbi:MAG: hypothetical protein WKG32_16845 [Gemmatimonadaceae bacterium]